MIEIDVFEDYQAHAWEEFSTTGKLTLVHDNGRSETFTRLVYGWEEESFVDTASTIGLGAGNKSATQWCGFFAGYCGDNDGTMSDSCNIPEEALAEILDGKFPGVTFQWNVAESHHEAHATPEVVFEDFTRELAVILEKNGFVRL